MMSETPLVMMNLAQLRSTTGRKLNSGRHLRKCEMTHAGTTIAAMTGGITTAGTTGVGETIAVATTVVATTGADR